MNRFLCLVGFSLILVSPASAQQQPQTVVWPETPLAPGANSAITPVPQVNWLERVQFNTNTAKQAPKLDLIFDGDSITDFWRTTGHEIWNDRYAKLNAYDFGISGDRTEHLLCRLQSGQVAGLHPKLVFIMIGTNNLAHNNSPDQIAEGVKAVVAEYQKDCPDAVIVLQAVFPRGASPQDPFRAKIKAINQTISQLGDGKKVIYLDFGDKFLQPDGTLSRDVMPDALHPSAAGYKIWADAIQPTIDQFFPPSQPQ